MDKKNYRHELKFIISDKIASILKYRLSLLMSVDSNYAKEDLTYFIRSLYFDDAYNSAYYEKIDGVEKRKKYRIRVYNYDRSFIRLEKKEKNNDLTLKEQTVISQDECLKFLNNISQDISTKNDSLFMEFALEKNVKNLKPSIVVDYDRLAYVYPVEDVRITFDENIRSGFYQGDLFDDNLITQPVLDANQVVLEVKYNDFMPNHLTKVLASIPMIRQAISKFALCKEQKEE